MAELYKYFVFGDPDWDYTEYDFSTWEADTAATADILNATDTDLGPFRDVGGKIIYWSGWSDLALTPLGTIDYYERLESGDPAARDYSRLYLLPGVLHCGGGPGPDAVDWIDAIRTWVEEGRAPERAQPAAPSFTLFSEYEKPTIARTGDCCREIAVRSTSISKIAPVIEIRNEVYGQEGYHRHGPGHRRCGGVNIGAVRSESGCGSDHRGRRKRAA